MQLQVFVECIPHCAPILRPYCCELRKIRENTLLQVSIYAPTVVLSLAAQQSCLGDSMANFGSVCQRKVYAYVQQ